MYLFGATRDFLWETGRLPVEKYYLIRWTNMGETNDLIVFSASTEYVSILFVLFLRGSLAFSITVTDTGAKRIGSWEGMSAR